MPFRIVATSLALLLLPATVEPTPPYQSALVTRMRVVQCAEPPRRGSIMADILVGSGPVTAMGECPEYELENSKVTYRIRPRRDVLLPVGDTVRFRIHKRDLLILTEDANKELVCGVVEMILRSRPIPVEQAQQKARKCLNLEGEVVSCGEK